MKNKTTKRVIAILLVAGLILLSGCVDNKKEVSTPKVTSTPEVQPTLPVTKINQNAVPTANPTTPIKTSENFSVDGKTKRNESSSTLTENGTLIASANASSATSSKNGTVLATTNVSSKNGTVTSVSKSIAISNGSNSSNTNK